ncbi:MAG: lipid-A-disaccharide synthase [Hyphomicrobiaceae bacterium]
MTPTASDTRRPLRVYLVAGEHSGDALGAKLMTALDQLHGAEIAYAGVGGPLMEARGLTSLFPLSDVAVMGPLAILKRLPLLVRRVKQAARAAAATSPDVVVVIDSPEFTQPIAKRIRRRLPDVPIINYVSPSVWAWRPGRAPRMARYIDEVMALLPFEPDVHRRLGGPHCTYVGHPLIERYAALQSANAPALAARLGLVTDARVLVVLPGSRRSEVERLMAPFGEAVALLCKNDPSLEVVIPTVPHVREIVAAKAGAWVKRPHLLDDEADKLAAFRLARAALAASGTVTLELALAGAPMVVAYRVDALAAQLRFLVKTPHFALANLVLGERAFPELMQEDCEPVRLAAALGAIIENGPERARQLAALARVPERMHLEAGTPSLAAAQIVLRHAQTGRGRASTRMGADA